MAYEPQFDEVDPRHPSGATLRTEPIDSLRDAPHSTLCLSGGGQRAAAYHLGALRRLWELGVLQEIDEIRAVSGGGYVAAWIATVLSEHGGRWDLIEWDSHIAKPFRRFLERDLRTLPIVVTAPVNFVWKTPRLRLLEWKLKRHLSLADSVENLDGLKIRVLATDLVDAKLVRLPDKDIRGVETLSRATIASTAFPPFFGPLRASRAGAPLQLSDGGLLGNLGVDGETIQLGGTVLISDASYPPTIASAKGIPRTWLLRALRVSGRRADELVRYQAWMTDVSARRLQVWSINRTTRGDDDRAPTFEYQRALVDQIAAVRTDLSGLTRGKCAIVENHGYLRASSCMSWLAHRMQRSHDAGRLPPELTGRLEALLLDRGHRPLVDVPFPEYMETNKCMQALRRFSRVRSIAA